MLKFLLLRLVVCYTKKRRLTIPAKKLIRAHVATLEWNMMSRKFGMTAAELVRLQEKSVELLESLKSELPEKTGVQNARKFEKVHSILHKVREPILFGWSENSAHKDRKTVILTSSRRLHTAVTAQTIRRYS
jgi:hypothetical protein